MLHVYTYYVRVHYLGDYGVERIFLFLATSLLTSLHLLHCVSENCHYFVLLWVWHT